MVKPERMLSGPIPGQSLTDTPKQYKWERPPQMADYEEVTKFYIEKLADKDVMDDLAVLFDNGMPIAPFVEALTTMGVSEGMHSIDVSLIVGPVVHAFVKAAMTQYGIDARDDVFNPEKDSTEREKRRLQTAVRLALAEAQSQDRTAETDTGVALLQQVEASMNGEEAPSDMTTEEEPMMDEAPVETPRKGLMAREAM